MADWRFYEHTAKFKSTNYFSSINVTSSVYFVDPGNRQINIRQFLFSTFFEQSAKLIPVNISGYTVAIPHKMTARERKGFQGKMKWFRSPILAPQVACVADGCSSSNYDAKT